MDQKKIVNRFKIAVPLFAAGALLTIINFDIIWRYFAWANQTLAMIMLWAAASYLVQAKKHHWICSLPAVFMSAVTSSYILQAKEGLRLSATFSNCVGIVFAIALFGAFINYTNKNNNDEVKLEYPP